MLKEKRVEVGSAKRRHNFTCFYSIILSLTMYTLDYEVIYKYP